MEVNVAKVGEKAAAEGSAQYIMGLQWYCSVRWLEEYQANGSRFHKDVMARMVQVTNHP